MTAKIGGTVYFFEPDDNHRRKFWTALLMELRRNWRIDFDIWWEMLIQKTK